MIANRLGIITRAQSPRAIDHDGENPKRGHGSTYCQNGRFDGARAVGFVLPIGSAAIASAAVIRAGWIVRCCGAGGI